MFLPYRVLAVGSMIALASCTSQDTSHDRLAYQSDYWRGRKVKAVEEKPKVDDEVQRQLDQAAAGAPAPGAPGVPASGAPATDPTGLPAGGGFPAAPATDPFAPAPGF